MAGMYDLGGGAPASANDPAQMLKMYQMMHAAQQGQQGGSSPAGAMSNSIMSMMLMNPDMFKQAGTGLSNLFSGATGSAIGQYMNPYGGTGAGMGPMVGAGGMNGGGT